MIISSTERGKQMEVLEATAEQWMIRAQERANCIMDIRTLTDGLPYNPQIDAACHVLANAGLVAASFAHTDLSILGRERGIE